MKCYPGMEPNLPCHDGKVYDAEYMQCRVCQEGYFKQGFTADKCYPCSTVQCPPNVKIENICTRTNPVQCSSSCVDNYQKNVFGNCLPCCGCAGTAKDSNNGDCIQVSVIPNRFIGFQLAIL